MWKTKGLTQLHTLAKSHCCAPVLNGEVILYLCYIGKLTVKEDEDENQLFLLNISAD